MRIFAVAMLAACSVHAAEMPPGEKIYVDWCAKCHDAAAPGARVPSRNALQQMTAAAIFKALESGVMRAQGEAIGPESRRVVADYMGVRTIPEVAPSGTGLCPASTTSWKPDLGAPAWNGWSPEVTNTRFAAASSAKLDAREVPRLKLKWAFSLGPTTMARAQPVVVGGRVFTSSQTGAVYSLDARTGCTYWKTGFFGPVRGGMAIATVQGRTVAFVGDSIGILHALDAATGESIWVRRLDDHKAKLVTATPQFYKGVVYVTLSSYEEVLAASPAYACCTFRGSVSAVDAATGNVLWKTYSIPVEPSPQKPNKAGVMQMGPSGAAIWAAPTVDPDKDVLYVATGDNYSLPTTNTSDAVLALDRSTGKMLWSKQLTANDAYNVGCDAGKENCPEPHGGDFDFGSSPALVKLSNGKRALVIGQKSGMLHALDPEDAGTVLWSARLGHGGALGGIQWGSAVEGEVVFTPLSDIGFDGYDEKKGLLTSPTKGGGLFAYNVRTGQKIWQAPAPVCGDRQPCSPAQSAAASAIPGVVLSGSLDGHLRAYASKDGTVIWDVDTVREYETVNGLPAKGGSLDIAGPAIVDGMVFVNSGYPQYGGRPGNVLLAFSVDGR